jgi:hypothetical protein
MVPQMLVKSLITSCREEDNEGYYSHGQTTFVDELKIL